MLTVCFGFAEDLRIGRLNERFCTTFGHGGGGDRSGGKSLEIGVAFSMTFMLFSSNKTVKELSFWILLYG